MTLTLSCDHRVIGGALGADCAGRGRARSRKSVHSAPGAVIDDQTRTDHARQRRRRQRQRRARLNCRRWRSRRLRRGDPRGSLARRSRSWKEHLGGICANWGCIPTKALFAQRRLFRRPAPWCRAGRQATGLRSTTQRRSRTAARWPKTSRRASAICSKEPHRVGAANVFIKRRDDGGLALTSAAKGCGRQHPAATGARPRVLPAWSPTASRSRLLRGDEPAGPASVAVHRRHRRHRR